MTIAEQYTGEYQANDADALVGELFSGKITVATAVERLRTRLLDLSARNSLLNYKHPKARCVQIANEPIVNLVFDRLYADAKAVPLKSVPEPDVLTYEGRRPEAKDHALRLGISTAFEFKPNPEGAQGHRLHGMQALLYPPELERHLRKLSSEAKTAIEETGSNMLFLIFGFLEFYDSEDSERPLLAPLLSLPVTLIRGSIDRETRTYQYSVAHNGEDLAENQTLREKLRRDFTLDLPEFEESETPESYFLRIEQAVKTKRRWRVRRQITLGLLSFGKLAIWADLDTKKNPGLVNHPLVKSVFSGGENSGGSGLHVEDYRIDETPSPPIIYNADSSQHSAIIDIIAGRNIVVIGPPGTGKSQTITNVIAAALSEGKKVLFVSEKVAALEVVRRRLNQAGLGHFCLELHSHKTQKKKFLEDIQERIEARFPDQGQVQSKLPTLNRLKVTLARYAELMGSRIGNKLGLTVNEVFWAAERRRQELGEVALAFNDLVLLGAENWTHDDIVSGRSRVVALANLFEAVGRLDAKHPWWGFLPRPLAPTDDAAISRIIAEALGHAELASGAAAEVAALFSLKEEPDSESSRVIAALFEALPSFPEEGEASLLPRLFPSDSDPKGRRSSKILAEINEGVEKERRLIRSSREILTDGFRLLPQAATEIEAKARSTFTDGWLLLDLREAAIRARTLAEAASSFAAAVRDASPDYGPAPKTAAQAFLSAFKAVQPSGLASYPASTVALRAAAVLEVLDTLSSSLAKIEAIASNRRLHFDGTPSAVAALNDKKGIPGLLAGASSDVGTLMEARRLASLPFAGKSIEALEHLKAALDLKLAELVEALKRCRTATERAGMSFDATQVAVSEIAALAAIAADAPAELLDHRLPSYGRTRATELAARVRASLEAERSAREELGKIFYLDALPGIGEIKSAIATLRSKDGPFAFLDSEWRRARALYMGLSREKRKSSARQRAFSLSALATWVEQRDAFVADPDFRDYFGGLFMGLDTDPDKIGRLNEWFLRARASIARHPGLADKVNLATFPAERISELAAASPSIAVDADRLAGAEAVLRELAGADIAEFRGAVARSWEDGLNALRHTSDNVGRVAAFFATLAEKTLSPRDTLRLLEARAELEEASSDLAALRVGAAMLREAGGDPFGRLVDDVGRPWREALSSVKTLVSAASDAAERARVFAGREVPLSVAATCAQSKANLNDAWAAVAQPRSWDAFDGWAALVESARARAADACDLISTLSPLAKLGVSAADVFRAYAWEAEGREILKALAGSLEVRSIIGDAFEWNDTEITRLSATHKWGSDVCSSNLPPPVIRKLLTEMGAEASQNGKRLYGEIENGCRKARMVLDGLSAFGAFSWEAWQWQYQGVVNLDLASQIKAKLEAAAANVRGVLPLSAYIDERLRCREDGLDYFVSALEAGKIPSRLMGPAFELATYRSIGKAIYERFPELLRFNGQAHEKTREEFTAVDAEIISLMGRDFATQINQRTHPPDGRRGTSAGEYTEMNLLRREIQKKARHIPIRQLVKRAGRALQELKPCFMMGPLSVAQYLEQGTLTFDLVVMDEASQLRPEEALGAIARGSQLMVVGDPKQLPPTNFFDRMVDSGDDEDEDAPAAFSGMESILDICQQIYSPVRSLRWHYRSKHESLIAFSNHHFYRNLILFPSPYAKDPGLGVKYRFIRNGVYRDRQNVPEAQMVVDAVLEHMLKRPSESLGVVTLNRTQKDLIEELLDNKLKTFPEGDAFIGHWEAEDWPFFVKNLENVQGDERDVIFISTTFGRAPGTDKVRQNFGPISRPDGWRRLNVLFTRSKRRIELFTSMQPGDIIVDEKTPLGTKALHDYLDFAKRGVLVSTDEGDREPDSDFEVSVANVILSKGYEVKPQLGVAGFFIDMAVRNPDRPGEFLAAIECDGATYHSGFSVRDRDHIRQKILESLGWEGRIYRIWSTDWFYNPGRETERLITFLEERRLRAKFETGPEWDSEALAYTMETAVVELKDVKETVEALSEDGDNEEDVFVEVGDRVTYCFLNDPAKRNSVLIIDGPSNTKTGTVNEMAPMAQALLGLSTGDVGMLEVPGQAQRQLQVLKIQRHGS